MEVSLIDFLTEFIAESDAIEGIIGNRSALRNAIRRGKKSGHIGAILSLEELAQDKMRALSLADIRLTQKLIVRNQHKQGQHRLHPRHIGRWRDVNVRVGGRECFSVPEVLPSMRDLEREMIVWQANFSKYTEEENIRKIADFHFRFLQIHPFVDGNGRTSRAIVYYLFRYANIRPFIFTSADKYETYYRCFDIETSERMQEYFLARA